MISRAVAAGLFLWMGYLFLVGPTVGFDGDGDRDLTVRCSPVTYYLSFDYTGSDLDVTAGPRLTFTPVRGTPQAVGSADLVEVYNTINTYCDRARTSRAATIGLLAAPTAVLVVWTARRPPAPVDSPPGSSPAGR